MKDDSISCADGRLRWFYPVVVAVLVVVASGRSQVAAPEIVDIDKAIHFSVFGLIATDVARALGRRRGWWAILIVSGFGISDEFRQSFTPGRSVEVADWVADTLGAAFATTLYLKWTWYRRLLEKPLRWRGRGAKVSVDKSTMGSPV
jgi:VanZ family protein